MDAFEITLWTRRLDQNNTSLWDLSDSALDTYVGLTVMPNATESINSLGAFTLELEALPTSTTQLESHFAESVLPLSFSTAINQVSINSSNVDWLTGIAVDAAYVGDLKNDSDITLTTLGNFDYSRFKDELTADETVDLAHSIFNPSTSAKWKSQVNDLVVTLENKRTIPAENYHVWDGLTEKTVSLTPSTFNPFTSTKERVFNIQNEFRYDNPIIEESRENVTPKFLRKVFGILERLDTVPENSIAVMGLETGGSYSSSKRNDLSESVSLIQFTDNGVQHSSTRGLASR